MAAFTGSPVSSTQYSNEIATNRSIDVGNSVQGLRIKHFATYTHLAANGAGTGTVYLGMLPAGRIKILPYLSHLVTTAFAANADIHIGYGAHTGLDGVAVVADDNAFLDNGDAGGGALNTALNLPAAGFLELNSKEGIRIEAMIDTGNIETDDTIDLWIAYIQA